jgi:hypothetical protein
VAEGALVKTLAVALAVAQLVGMVMVLERDEAALKQQEGLGAAVVLVEPLKLVALHRTVLLVAVVALGILAAAVLDKIIVSLGMAGEADHHFRQLRLMHKASAAEMDKSY